MRPTSKDLGLQKITIELSDIEGLFKDFILSILVIDTFEYQSKSVGKIIVFYPEVYQVDISKQISQSLTNTYSIYIKENSKEIGWVYYEAENIITISNYTPADFGEHYLLISIYDEWFSRYFNFSMIVLISPPHPPAITGTIQNITIIN